MSPCSADSHSVAIAADLPFDTNTTRKICPGFWMPGTLGRPFADKKPGRIAVIESGACALVEALEPLISGLQPDRSRRYNFFLPFSRRR